MKYLPLGASRDEIDFLKNHGVKYDKKTLRSLVLAYEYSHLPSMKDVEGFFAENGLLMVGGYVDFLCSFNGGRPDPCLLNFDGRCISVQFFYALESPMESCTLKFAVGFYDGRVPSGFLPIAHDSEGGLLVLDCRENKRGEVFYWDHSTESDVPNVSSLKLVCADFYALEKLFDQ